MPDPEPFEIASGAEFQQKYPGYFEEAVRNLPPIDLECVPDNLKHLIPYAQIWGIPDDFVRSRFCESAPLDTAADFKRALAGTHSLYEEWIYTVASEDEAETMVEKIKYAQWRFTHMYVAELEAFDGIGLRSFVDWYKSYDPEGYQQWLQS